MLITNSQLEEIQAGTLFYQICEYCGEAILSTDDVVLCPKCRRYMDQAGDDWGFGFGFLHHRKFGLGYELHTGDFKSGH